MAKKKADKAEILKIAQQNKEPIYQSRNHQGEVEPVERYETTESEINALHNKINQVVRDAVRHGIRIGELLAIKKEELNHGEFTPYVEKNFAFGVRAAQKYMKLFHYREQILPALEEAQLSGIGGALQLVADTEDAQKEAKSERRSLLEKEAYSYLVKETKEISQRIYRLKNRKTLENKDLQTIESDLGELIKLVKVLRNDL